MLAGCSSEPPREAVIGEAYVGPMALNLRDELAARAKVIATVHHGDKLDILGYRRKFAKVRTGSGIEGWADGRLLMSPAQMARMRKKAAQASELPSQGKATPFDLLNVHVAPNRQAPSFFQIREGDHVDVVGRRVAPRVPYDPDLDGKVEDAPPESSEDSWSLVRLSDSRAGWVLSSMVMMSIPDEVAQYAEGHHITSYFSLGTVKDGDQEKHHWLWTTNAARLSPYDFDSLRIFVYNPRRHRYETAYIDRNLKGHYPVEVHGGDSRTMPDFSIIVTEKDGTVVRRRYQFQGYRPRLVAKEPWQLSTDDEDSGSEATEVAAKSAPAGSLWERAKRTVSGWF